MNDATLSPYPRLGGDPGLRARVARFYAFMDTLPEAAPIRGMHPADLDRSKDRLFKFLSGWLGGPDLYREEFGHPRLRMRHFPFAIGPAAVDQWLLCLRRALDAADLDPDFKAGLYQALARTAHHMMNSPA